MLPSPSPRLGIGCCRTLLRAPTTLKSARQIHLRMPPNGAPPLCVGGSACRLQGSPPVTPPPPSSYFLRGAIKQLAAWTEGRTAGNRRRRVPSSVRTMPYPERIQDEVRHIFPGETAAGGGEPEASTERYFSVRWIAERERARQESDDCSSAFAIIPVGE